MVCGTTAGGTRIPWPKRWKPPQADRGHMEAFQLGLTLLVAVVLVGITAQRFALPAPVVLVVAGLALALVPGLPRIEFDPYLVFVIFIPPLLYRAAITASLRDLRANLRPIVLLSVGLVVF